MSTREQAVKILTEVLEGNPDAFIVGFGQYESTEIPFLLLHNRERFTSVEIMWSWVAPPPVRTSNGAVIKARAKKRLKVAHIDLNLETVSAKTEDTSSEAYTMLTPALLISLRDALNT